MSAPSTSPPAAGAVFLSYASQDAEAAKRLCAALRAVGVEVWFDQNELVGGDAWDAKIRQQIAACALFVPIISANTQARLEGYFRIEWKLAARRTHAMATAKAFLLPIVIDGTRDAEAHVPDEFRDVQWTRLPGAEAPEKFCTRVQTLLEGNEGLQPTLKTTDPRVKHRATPGARRRVPTAVWLAAAVASVVLATTLYFARRPAETADAAARRPAAEQSAAPRSEAHRLVAEIWAQLNKAELARLEIETADELGKRATELAPNEADAWAAWSQVDSWGVYHNFTNTPERRESARTKAAKALQLAPRSFEARLAVVCQIVRAGDTAASVSAFAAQAEAALEELLKERPAEPRALLVRGILQRNLGKQEAARATFHQLAANPRFAATAWTELGWAEMGWGDLRASSAAAERAVAVQPFWGSLSLKLETSLWWIGDRDLAKAAFDRMPSANLQEDFVIAEGALLYYARREPEAMLHLLASAPREWLTSNLFDGPTGYLSGNAHAMAKRPDAAQQHWQRALRLVEQRLTEKPNAAPLVFWNGRLQALTGRRSEAAKTIALARQLAMTRSQRGDRTYEAMVDQLLVGSPDSALQMLEEAVERKQLTLAGLEIEPDFDPLRGTPRFEALLARAKADPQLSPAAGTAHASTTAAKSVAVLAFKNLSGDPAREFFSDGLSEAVSDVLGRVPGLKVVGSASAFSFKGKAVPIPEIARKLGVTHVVEGTVLQDGTAVRITAKLIQADGFQVWVSDKLDRELKNIFALHDEVAGLIAQNLSLKLGVDARRPRQEIDLEAYQLYLQARQAWSLRNSEGLARAEELLERSLKFEPDYAQAHVALADVWSARSGQAGVLGTFDQRQSSEKARILAKIDHALRLDPDSAEARASLGSLAWYDWEFVTAERELRRAVSLNPNYATAHQWLGRSLQGQGRMEEALAALRRAAEIDPLSPVGLANYCGRLVEAGRDAESLAVAERGLTLLPNGRALLMHKGHALANLGRRPEAAAVARQLAATDPTDPNNLFPAVFILACAGETAEATAMMATLPDRGRLPRTALLLALGRREDAIAALDPSAQNVNFIGLLLFDRRYDPIRGEPRFAKFLAELGLTEAHARAQAWRKAHPPERPSAR